MNNQDFTQANILRCPRCQLSHIKRNGLRWFNKSGEKTVFGKISKICGKNRGDEFKRNTLDKVFDGQSIRSVAEELGINESLIHKWKRAAKTFGSGTRSGAELNEIEVLKKRNRELEQENEILSDPLRGIFGRGI